MAADARRWWIGGTLAAVILVSLVLWAQWHRSLDRIHYSGRHYDRGQSEKVPSDAVSCGKHTFSHQDASVFVPAGDGCSHPIILWIRTKSGSWEYALVGGP